jgi:hypothetical protein
LKPAIAITLRERTIKETLDNTSYITASCSISGNEVIKNGRLFFENQGTSVQEFLLSVYQYLGSAYPRFYKMDNLSRLGWLTTELLLRDSLAPGTYAPEDMGLLFCNRNSSLDTDIRFAETMKTMASPALFVYTLPNIVMGEICIRHNFKGENDFFIFDTFNPGFITFYLEQLFSSGAIQAGICGWLDLIGEEYRSCLFLVERKSRGQHLLFTEQHLQNIYLLQHG